jgi:molybdopterin molybdotransferase
MEIQIQLTATPIAEKIFPPANFGAAGAWLEFRGLVRDEENGAKISALEYEAYPAMAEREIRRLLENISARHPCLAVRVIHRTGRVPVDATAIFIGIASRHRAEGLALLGEFMDRLKQDVPIWKRRAVPAPATSMLPETGSLPAKIILKSLDEAILEIQSRCQLRPAIRVLLEDSFGRVLRETVCAPEDLPPFDCSTRDGFAILADDPSENFRIVDTIHAAGWQPRELKIGETVRVATGAPLPCRGVRVVMQEDVRRDGDRINIVSNETALNLRRRGEEVKKGQPLVPAGARLDAGKLALLATAGCGQPLVSPRLRVMHFTTGDEIIPPSQTPQPGQIRDSNSFLIRGLLEKSGGDLIQAHLPENVAAAKAASERRKPEIEAADLILISGGASVGDKDFTRPLLEHFGFEIIFSQVNLRPGKPLIFGTRGPRVAFGLPGNPLSHFVCFHFAVATALATLTGIAGPKFLRGKLSEKLDEAASARETLWPARLFFSCGEIHLQPLPWASAGDVTCFATANALLRVPPNQNFYAVGTEMDFLPTTDMLGA